MNKNEVSIFVGEEHSAQLDVVVLAMATETADVPLAAIDVEDIDSRGEEVVDDSGSTLPPSVPLVTDFGMVASFETLPPLIGMEGDPRLTCLADLTKLTVEPDGSVCGMELMFVQLDEAN